MTDEARAAFGAITEPDWSDRAAAIDYLTELSRALAGRSHPFDEDAERARSARASSIARRTSSRARGTTTPPRAASRWRERLGGLDVPTLVIHGTEDPIFPVGHGEALAREIPGAELLVLAGTGHELPRRDWDVVVPAILRVTRGS